jgi:4-phospho-D-threonate 3-dehydrogenase / 4-phospho-D-erythronate 3-dehydrogenase
MGDAGGIGPEVLVAALADRELRRSARFHIHGSSHAMLQAAATLGIEPYWWTIRHGGPSLSVVQSHDVVLIDHDPPGEDVSVVHRPSKPQGAASFAFVEHAIAATKLKSDDPGYAHAIVTGPISKAAWVLAGRTKYPGHSELLAQRLGARRWAMFFAGGPLRVVLVTVHQPLMEIRNTLTLGRIVDAIDLGAQACRDLGIASPRVAVCGLNPHAGEDGLLGDEEQRLITPAIELARAQGIDVTGPWPADTVFNAALPANGRPARHDLVVAMYHDQGLIPVKLLARDSSVNITLGLPTVRTSPDHGTAYDIAGRGIANPGSMTAALRMAVEMAGHRLAQANPSQANPQQANP